MSTGPVVRVTHRFRHSPERVFDAWLDPAKARRFLFATEGGQMIKVEIDARVGGRFSIIERRGDQEAAHEGEYLEIDRPRRLVFTFGVPAMNPGFDRVTVEIRPLADGCELTLIHEMTPGMDEYFERTAEGWTKIVAGLDRMLTGDQNSPADGTATRTAGSPDPRTS